MWVAAYGDPFSGVTLVGPFKTSEDAQAYAERELSGGLWWCVKLESPEQEGD